MRKIFTVKKFFITLLSVFLLISSISIVSAQEPTPPNFDLDIVFIIDNSGSMVTLDANNDTMRAVEIFLNLVRGSDTRAGFVLYADDRNNTSFPFTDVSDEPGANLAMHRVNAMPLRRVPAWTDIGWGFVEAVRMLENRGDSHRAPVVILITDGHIDMGPTPASPQGFRTRDESVADIHRMSAEFESMGIRLHTICFMLRDIPDRWIPHMHVDLIEDVTTGTGGLFLPINNAYELQDAMAAIWAYEVANIRPPWPPILVEGDSHPINVPHDRIFRMDVVITTNEPGALSDMYIIHPNRMPIDFRRAPNIHYDESDMSIVLRIHRPIARGDWTLRFPDRDDSRIVVHDFFTITDFGLALTLSANQSMQGDQIIFTPRLDIGGFLYAFDSALLGYGNLTLHITHPSGEITSHDLEPNTYEWELYFDELGNYQARIELVDEDGVAIPSPLNPFEIVEWVLTVDNFTLSLTGIPSQVVQGEVVNFTPTFTDNEGNLMDIDVSLMDSGSLALYVTRSDGIATNHPLGQGARFWELNFAEIGVHHVWATMNLGEDVIFSQEFLFDVSPAPIIVGMPINAGNIVYRGLVRILSEENRQVHVYIRDHLESFFPDSRFGIRFYEDEWSEYFSIDFDEETGYITITAQPNSGFGLMYLTVYNQWGVYARIQVSANITSWWDANWLFVVIALAIVVIVLLAVWYMIWKRKPFFKDYNGRLVISLQHPASIPNMQLKLDEKFWSPRFPFQQSRISLYEMFDFQRSDTYPNGAGYLGVLGGKEELLKRVMLVAEYHNGNVRVAVESKGSDRGNIVIGGDVATNGVKINQLLGSIQVDLISNDDLSNTYVLVLEEQV